jgi:succinate-acetate transporter protein
VWSRGFSSLGGVEGVSCCWSCFSGGLFLSVLCSVEANHGVFLFLMVVIFKVLCACDSPGACSEVLKTFVGVLDPPSVEGCCLH